MIVTDPGVRAAGIVDPITASLSRRRRRDRRLRRRRRQPARYRRRRGWARGLAEKVDLIVAVGGGSPMDTAKGVGVLQTHGGRITGLGRLVRRHQAHHAAHHHPDDLRDRQRGQFLGGDHRHRSPLQDERGQSDDRGASRAARPRVDTHPAAAAHRVDRDGRALAFGGGVHGRDRLSSRRRLRRGRDRGLRTQSAPGVRGRK